MSHLNLRKLVLQYYMHNFRVYCTVTVHIRYTTTRPEAHKHILHKLLTVCTVYIRLHLIEQEQENLNFPTAQ